MLCGRSAGSRCLHMNAIPCRIRMRVLQILTYVNLTCFVTSGRESFEPDGAHGARKSGGAVRAVPVKRPFDPGSG